jgi:hypothetical protein
MLPIPDAILADYVTYLQHSRFHLPEHQNIVSGSATISTSAIISIRFLRLNPKGSV